MQTRYKAGGWLILGALPPAAARPAGLHHSHRIAAPAACSYKKLLRRPRVGRVTTAAVAGAALEPHRPRAEPSFAALPPSISRCVIRRDQRDQRDRLDFTVCLFV